MSWIKENKFLAGLLGGTLVGVVALYFVGSRGAGSYDTAKEQFDLAAGEASAFERLSLYPTTENANAKRKALDEYKQSADELQAAFEPFRPKEITNISPQDFTNKLKTVNDEVRKALNDGGTKVPDAFFCGFEGYKTNPAAGPATGILGYQLDFIKSLMLSLAKSGASELKNLHRPLLAEEEGKEFKPADAAVARALPLEITFSGPEKAVRAFLSSITKPEGKYVVIRSMRISNAKKDPPRTADAKFEAPRAARPAAGEAFSGGFVLPGEEPATPTDKPAEAPAPAPAPAPSDSSRILAQVLGNEEVQVFLRLDLMQFLPAKKLP